MQRDKLKLDLANYHRNSIFSQVLYIFLKAIKNKYVTTFLGLTRELIKKTYKMMIIYQKVIKIKKDKVFKVPNLKVMKTHEKRLK